MILRFVIVTALASLGMGADLHAAERQAVAASAAAEAEGRVATVRGRVIEVRRVAGGPIIFEIDGKPGAPAFRALVYPMAVPRFRSSLESDYLGRIVEVTGLVTVRKNLPQTWINDPSALLPAPVREVSPTPDVR